MLLARDHAENLKQRVHALAGEEYAGTPELRVEQSWRVCCDALKRMDDW